MVERVIVDSKGSITLNADILEHIGASHGAEVIVKKAKKGILIFPSNQLRMQVAAFKRRILRRLKGKSGKDLFIGDLTVDEYLSLSQEEQDAFWKKLYDKANPKDTYEELEVPSDFSVAGQKRG